MKTAILGGSFDPVHQGHIMLARTVLRDTPYQRILFIPAGSPPHKSLSEGASDNDRLRMLELALENEAGTGIWDGELRKDGPSYSIETIRQLRAEGTVSGKPGLIIGDDLVAGFRSWKESRALADETEILLARRLGKRPDELPFSCLPLDNELWPWSSTEVRELLRTGGDLSTVLNHHVADYIMENHLYGYAG